MLKYPLATLSIFLLCIPGLAAQSTPGWNPQGLVMSREALEEQLELQMEVANSSAYSGRIRESARQDAELIRRRLEEGDFRVGDGVQIRVDGEPGIPPQLPVEPGPQIVFPTMGPISLRGVLRSELQGHLITELSRFIQAPMVQAEPLIRVSMQGTVGQPGFYVIPADMLLSEALMAAGGPGGGADLEAIRIERIGDTLWEGDEIRAFLAEGRTLDQLNLQGGDQIFIPAVATGNFWNSGWGTVTRWGLGIASTVFFGYRLFGGGGF